ncbi:oxidoreductase [Arsenicicoccus sp. MKL-02]|uniref:Oxidoreductase n=1 Tax=Arsenicicoccus cauae TaxID=2663847 RepID=A0A6I3J0A4_9MICO|nr:FMN reductase [Arsenicicoccus cauae]MTB72746.1 oxidoreductase [Arsenicicoccus cauae]
MTRRIVAVTAGLSQPSSTRLLTDQLTAAVTAQVSARGEAATVEVIEVRELATDLAHLMTTGMASARLDAARELVSSADGLVLVTPVFSASYSGLFKMFVDALSPDALTGMPVIVAATAGTPRHSLVLDFAMRPLLTYLRAVVMPTGVFAATEDFGGGEAGSGLASRVRRAASELAALVVAESGAVAGFAEDEQDREPVRPDRSSGVGLGSVTPFEQLLAGHRG